MTAKIVALLAFLSPITGFTKPLSEFKGQLSLSYNYNSSNKRGTLRYIPDILFKHTISKDSLWDINISANIYGKYKSPATDHFSSQAKIYRLNAQLKTLQSDVRIGLQKINFGSAVILRSLRWFDQLDPTDPLGLTEGVIGVRYRRFFLNNTNIWIWGLYHNKKPKGHEIVATQKNTPELGVRLEFPLTMGELGFSFHGRQTQTLDFTKEIERRLAIDGKFDLTFGIWYEYVVIHDEWVSLTLGADYTFGIGHGLHILVEHLIKEKLPTSAIQANYPTSMLDTLSFLKIYSWTQKQGIHYLNWIRTYDNLSFNLGVFWAPKQTMDYGARFSGHGVQAAVTIHH